MKATNAAAQPAARKYYSLAVRYEDGIWACEFGSYKRSEVLEEREVYADQGLKTKIVESFDNQDSITFEFRRLNRK
ncbi:hypothetical protein D3C81_1623880 [compost metagenome]